MRLEGKTIVVTGASAGMGQAIVTLFAQEGANIIAVARRKERLDAMAEELKDAPGKVVPYAGDVSDPAVCEGMIDAAVKEFGRLDVLVNNAGIMDDNTAVGDVSNEMIDRLIRVNTCGPLYAMRKAVQVFLKQNEENEYDEPSGNIINVCSVGAFHQTAGVAYCASKAAITSATKNTAFMYIDKGIRCNGIAPGGVITDIPLVMPKADTFGFERTGSLLAHAPELGMPEDIANTAFFLASDESRFINGTIITCDGGWTCF